MHSVELTGMNTCAEFNLQKHMMM